MYTTRAIVAHKPTTKPPSPNLSLEHLSVSEPGPGQLLIKFAAVGVCHTDIAHASRAGFGNWVPGHEGAGHVLAVGAGVTKAKVGDPVLMSFVSCTKCERCRMSHPSQCPDFVSLNLGLANDSAFKDESTSSPVKSSFFGQSSFANISVVEEADLLNAKGLIRSDEELNLFAPLGCGLMVSLKGASSVINVVKADASTSLVVFGLGGVGLAAVMAAKVQQYRHIIAVDRVASRLELARQLGATHVIDTTKTPVEELAAEVIKLTGTGAAAAIDTTGVQAVQEAGFYCLRNGGELIILAIPNGPFALNIPSGLILGTAKTIRGSIVGDAVSAQFIPVMVDWYRKGQFPLEKLVKYMPAEEFGRALNEMHSGETVKPILVW